MAEVQEQKTSTLSPSSAEGYLNFIESSITQEEQESLYDLSPREQAEFYLNKQKEYLMNHEGDKKMRDDNKLKKIENLKKTFSDGKFEELDELYKDKNSPFEDEEKEEVSALIENDDPKGFSSRAGYKKLDELQQKYLKDKTNPKIPNLSGSARTIGGVPPSQQENGKKLASDRY